MESTTQTTMKQEHSQLNAKFKAISTNTLLSAHGALYAANGQHSQAICPFEIPVSWNETDFRQATLEAEIEHGIAWQVRVNREERGWTQTELAQRMRTGQPAISKLEDPSGGDVQLSTLVKAAHAFDCALVVRLVSYAEFGAQTADVRPDRLLACGFEAERKPAVFISYQSNSKEALSNAF